LLDYSDLEKYDPSGMHKVYDDWAKIARKSFDTDLEPASFNNIDHIIFSGMGGSGAIGDLFSSILSKTNIHVNVVKGYLLPKTVDSNTLVVTTSVSGNTVETMSILESAHKLNCKVIGFSSGGLMESFCLKNGIEYRNIPKIHSSRASFTKYVYSILKVLNSIIPVGKHDIESSLNNLEILSKQICSENLNDSNLSLDLANWISGIPMIYYPAGLEAAAIRFKNSLQENTKSHAIAEDVLEACHNGIVSWEKPSNINPILIEGLDDYIKTKERWQILKKYFEFNGINYREIFSVEGNILSKMICLIYLLDCATIYLAAYRKVNPSPVKSIDFIKERI